MQDITLDFTGCKYFLELHDVLKKAFGFPDYYGKNLDALWDCLDNYCDWDLCVYVEMSRYVQSKNPLNLKYTQYRICFSE